MKNKLLIIIFTIAMTIVFTFFIGCPENTDGKINVEVTGVNAGVNKTGLFYVFENDPTVDVATFGFLSKAVSTGTLTLDINKLTGRAKNKDATTDDELFTAGNEYFIFVIANKDATKDAYAKDSITINGNTTLTIKYSDMTKF